MLIKYDVRTGIPEITAGGCKVIEDSQRIFMYGGEFTGSNDITAGELNEMKIQDLCGLFFGPFMAVCFRKQDGSLKLRQHFFGSPVNVWITRKEHSIFISTSLKELLGISGLRAEFNGDALPAFLYNGFVPGGNTLIRGVYRLVPGTSMTICRDQVISEPDLCSFEEKETSELAGRYHEILSGSVKNSLDRIPGAGYNVTLSAGFDSNCILWNLRKIEPDAAVHAYCVGGKRGVNEIGSARRIAGMYDHVDFSHSLVDPETLSHIDEIVETLEGSVYERGIFLQYELGKLLAAHNVRDIICGECADQVFHSKLFDGTPDAFMYSYTDHPYVMASNVVLKKNCMLMAAKGIRVHYPFLDSRFLEFGWDSRNLNGTTKEFHKKQCYADMPARIMELVSKQGGTTDMSALFEEGTDCMKEAERFRFFDRNFRITRRFPPDEAVRDYYLTLAYLESFCNQFIHR